MPTFIVSAPSRLEQAGRVACPSEGQRSFAVALLFAGRMPFREPLRGSGMRSFWEGCPNDWTKLGEEGPKLPRAELARASEPGPIEPMRRCRATRCQTATY